MTPFFEAIGKNIVKSADQVYDHLETSRIPYRVLSGVWENEFEKRKTGYSACRYRYRICVDADEIYFFHEQNLEQFLRADAAVGITRKSVYLAPGWMLSDDPVRPFFFDSKKITADNHLNYLWLVDKLPLWLLGKEPPPSADQPPIYPAPLAFTAHLTHWRTPATSVNRAAFYTLNWIRHNGAPGYQEGPLKPLADLDAFFKRIPPRIYLDTLKNNDIVVGHEELGGRFLKPSPLAARDDARLTPLFENFLRSQAITNQEFAAVGRHTFGPVRIDMTSEAAAVAISAGGAFIIESQGVLNAAKSYLHYLIPGEPWELLQEVPTEICGNRLKIDLPPPLDTGTAAFLRKVLTLQAWAANGDPVIRFVQT